jgi:hypothetical protein
VCESEIVKDL